MRKEKTLRTALPHGLAIALFNIGARGKEGNDMATNRQTTKRRTYELIKESEKLMKENTKKLLSSEEIDFSQWDDDYKLPRLLLVSVASVLEREFAPHPMGDKENELLGKLKAHL